MHIGIMMMMMRADMMIAAVSETSARELEREITVARPRRTRPGGRCCSTGWISTHHHGAISHNLSLKTLHNNYNHTLQAAAPTLSYNLHPLVNMIC